jgi:hypothetical protein
MLTFGWFPAIKAEELVDHKRDVLCGVLEAELTTGSQERCCQHPSLTHTGKSWSFSGIAGLAGTWQKVSLSPTFYCILVF